MSNIKGIKDLRKGDVVAAGVGRVEVLEDARQIPHHLPGPVYGAPGRLLPDDLIEARETLGNIIPSDGAWYLQGIEDISYRVVETYTCSYCDEVAAYVGASGQGGPGSRWSDGDFYCEAHKGRAPGGLERA